MGGTDDGRPSDGAEQPPRRLTRRAALRLFGALGATGLLSACGGGAATPTAKPAEATKPAASPAAVASPGAAASPSPSPAASPSPSPSPAAAAPAAPAAAAGPVTVAGFPSRGLRILAPAAPGGGWDGTSRAVQQVLQDERIAAQPIEVFNRPGAGGTIGLAELINQSRGDGHTVMTMGLIMLGSIRINKAPVNLDPVVPLARLTTEYQALAVGNTSKYQTLEQLVDDFKRDPRAISWGGGSAGGTDHIVIGLLAREIGVNPREINFVAFSGGDLIPQVIGNQVTVGSAGYAEFKGQAASGQVRVLAISSPQRLPGADVPTMKELGYNVELTNWRGMVGPPGMRDNEREAWTTMLTRMRDSRAWRDTLDRQDWIDAFLAGDPFASFMKQEDERIGQVLTDLGLA